MVRYDFLVYAGGGGEIERYVGIGDCGGDVSGDAGSGSDSGAGDVSGDSDIGKISMVRIGAMVSLLEISEDVDDDVGFGDGDVCIDPRSLLTCFSSLTSQL